MLNEPRKEILTILLNGPKPGMSTADIFKVSTENTESHIADPEQVSKTIYNLRSLDLIHSCTNTDKIKFHKITEKGIAALEIPDNVEPTATPIATEELVEHQFYLNPDNPVEQSMMVIAAALRDIEPIKIKRKTQKIGTLTRLGALMSDDINKIFNEVIDDLKNFDEI